MAAIRLYWRTALKLKICNVPGGNFGDDLNKLIWREIFPNILEIRNDCIVYGIGTILGGHNHSADTKIILGSGLGYKKVNALDKHWDIRWVREKLSAQALGLNSNLALGDGAVLWPELKTANNAGTEIGFIPHHATWSSYDWKSIAQESNLTAINPKDSPTQVANQIRQCSRVITESLHGAIFADSLQIPWHPVVLSYRFNNFKWNDWLSIYNLTFNPSISPAPLSYDVSQINVIKNFCARTIFSDNNYRYNSLRTVKVSTESDKQDIINFLRAISVNETLFTCSTASILDSVRNKLHEACKKFAREYDLTFTM